MELIQERIAVYPGTFDPVTLGHEALVKRALGLFDKIIIAIGHNSEKKTMFSLSQRMEWLDLVFKLDSRVEVAYYEGLTVDFCRSKGANFILRGLRSSFDFEFERNIAQANQVMEPSLETLFLLSNPGLSMVSSSIVRDIYRNGGEWKRFVPMGVELCNDSGTKS